MQKIFLWDKEIHFFDILRRIIFAKFIENFDYKVQLILSNSSNKTLMWNAYLGIATSFCKGSCMTAYDTTLASRPVTSFPWRKNSKKSFHICLSDQFSIYLPLLIYLIFGSLSVILPVFLALALPVIALASVCFFLNCVLVRGFYVYHKHYCYFL